MVKSACVGGVGGRFMMSRIRKLGHIGVTDDLPARDARHVVLLNYIVLLIFVVGIRLPCQPVR